MTRAFEKLPVGVPSRDVAAGMRADRRIGDDVLHGALLGLAIEAFGVEVQQQNLVEPRAAAYCFALRLYRPGHDLLAGSRDIRDRQWLRSGGADRHQKIALPRPFARRIGLCQDQTRGKREAHTPSEYRSASYRDR